MATGKLQTPGFKMAVQKPMVTSLMLSPFILRSMCDTKLALPLLSITPFSGQTSGAVKTVGNVAMLYVTLPERKW